MGLAHTEAHSAAQAGAGAAAFLTETQDYLQSVGSYVAAALDPLGIDVKIDIETPEGRKSCHVTRQTSSTTSSTTQEASAEEKKEEGDKKVEEEPKKADQVEPEPAKKAATHLMMRRTGLWSLTRRTLRRRWPRTRRRWLKTRDHCTLTSPRQRQP